MHHPLEIVAWSSAILLFILLDAYLIASWLTETYAKHGICCDSCGESEEIICQHDEQWLCPKCYSTVDKSRQLVQVGLPGGRRGVTIHSPEEGVYAYSLEPEERIKPDIEPDIYLVPTEGSNEWPSRRRLRENPK